MLDTVQPANLRKSLCIHQDEEDSFTIFIVSNGTFLILVKLSITYYESWYLVPSYEKTYSKCSSLLSSSEPNSAYQTPSGETLEERLPLTDTRSPTAITSSTDDYASRYACGCSARPSVSGRSWAVSRQKNGRNGNFKVGYSVKIFTFTCSTMYRYRTQVSREVDLEI